MAIGIGIMTTLFSVVYGVLLKPLPWPEADRLVWLTESHPGATRLTPWTMTNAAYLAWNRLTGGFIPAAFQVAGALESTRAA